MKINVIVSNITFEGNINTKGEKFFIFSFDKNQIEGDIEDIEWLIQNTPWFNGMKTSKYIYVKVNSSILLEKGMSISLDFDKKTLTRDTKQSQYNITNPKLYINQFIGETGFLRYLETINGIGKVSAKKIVENLKEHYSFKDTPMVEKFLELVTEESEIVGSILKKKISKVQDYLHIKHSSFEEEKESSSLNQYEEIFGHKYGISKNVLLRIKKGLIYKLKNNPTKMSLETSDVSAFLKYKPYYLASDTEFSRLGFKTIDKISYRIRNDENNFGSDSFNEEDFKKQRFFGFLHCAITEGFNSDGHMFMKLVELREAVIKQNKDREVKGNPELHIDVFEEQNDFNMYLFDILDGLREEGIEDFILFENEEDLGLTTLQIHKRELNLAEKLVQLNCNTPFIERKNITKEEILKTVVEIEKEEGIQLSVEQRESVLNSLHSPLNVITGGPGTGKTTTSNVLIKTLQKFGASIKVLAPTGTAANRVSLVSGFNASTIHRGLGSKGIGPWKYNENNPLEEDIIVVDESSMIDIMLGEKLIPPCLNSNIIFLGDINQLPSVGAGRFLGDIISSEKFNVSKLTKIFRQAAGNPIIQLAYAINSGDSKSPYQFMTSNTETIKENKLSIIIKEEYKQPDPKNDNQDGLSEFEREELKMLGEYDNLENTRYMDHIIDDAIDMAETTHHLEKSIYDVQVLTNSNIAANKINQQLQNKLNPGGLIIPKSKGVNTTHSTQIRIGDKVMHTKNNYKLEIFNGSIGRVTSYNHQKGEVEVIFTDGQLVVYPLDVFAKEVRLTYCMTIHKSQGQEFKHLIMVSLWNPLSREILYTGVTRAKERLIMFTNEKILRTGIFLSGEDKLKRNTRLSEFLKDEDFIENYKNYKYINKNGDYHILSPKLSSELTFEKNDLENKVPVSKLRKKIEDDFKEKQLNKSLNKNIETSKKIGSNLEF